MCISRLTQARALRLVFAALVVSFAHNHFASAQLLEVPSIVHEVKGTHDRIDMVVNSSRHLVMDKKIPQAQVGNPEIVTATPLAANKIQISAKKPGVTQVNLWDEDNQVHTVDVVVFADAQELTLLLKTQFPKSSLRVIPLANSVLITGYVDDPDEITRITEIAQDYHPKVLNQVRVGGVQQVLLYVRVMEVSRTDLRELGVDFGVFNSNDFITSGVSGILNAATPTQNIALNGAQLTFGVFNAANRLNGILKCLRQNDLLKIVAEPNLVCVSGRPAFFNVGGEFPIIVPQSLGTVSVQYKKFGTQLDFVPIVLGNNRIRLEVRPRVSEIDPARGVFINGQQVPGLRVREVETGVEMRAGETLAIAGLLQQRTEMRKRGIPYLGDLPCIGVIFRSVRSEVAEIETLILVTPQFVEAMEVCEVPEGGPGLQSCPPNHAQLYCGGRVEVPCCNNGYQTQIPGFGAGGPMPGEYGPGPMMGNSGLIGPPPAMRQPAEVVAPPQAPTPAPRPRESEGPALQSHSSAAYSAPKSGPAVHMASQQASPQPKLQAQYAAYDITPRPSAAGGQAAGGAGAEMRGEASVPPVRSGARPGMIGPSGYQSNN